MKRHARGALVASIAAVLLAAGSPRAELLHLGPFPSGLAEPVSCGFDPTTERVWVYTAFGANLNSFSRFGAALSTLPRPGEAADDCDITFAPSGFNLGATPVAAGALLFVNGESAVAEVYAVDKLAGTVTATLPTAFGVSHVVGGSYHAGRGTMFLVQDRQPSVSTNDNLLAEVQTSSGSVLGSFATTAASAAFTVNFGDVEVGANGNLFVVSSDETSILEVGPTGALVQLLPLPTGVASLSGLGIDHVRGEGWVSGTGGTVWRLFGFPAAAGSPPWLILSKDVSGVPVLHWATIVGASGYDVTFGDLNTLRQTGGGYAAATTGCLGNDLTSSAATDSAPLGPEAARWYLVRSLGSSYDVTSPRQVGSRDSGIAASGLGCP